MSDVDAPNGAVPEEPSILVRRIHRRDLNKVWEFLKLCFRVVNRKTLEYQRPRSKKRSLKPRPESKPVTRDHPAGLSRRAIHFKE